MANQFCHWLGRQMGYAAEMHAHVIVQLDP